MSDNEWHEGERDAGDGAPACDAGEGERASGAGEGEPACDAGKGEPPLMHDGIPISGYYRGEPIPDLNALPEERWLEVLRPLSFWPRTHATARVRTVEQASVAMQVKGQLLLEDGPPPHARPIEGASGAIPRGAPPARGAGRQVNFRLGPQEHARLVEASKLFAMTPTGLARILTVRGVERALNEERRAR